MKKIYISLFAFISFTFSAQVGVNTSNPQGVFNIDGQKNNLATGTPTAAQQQDDFVVTQQGRVGVGSTAPTAKLEVNSSSSGAIKIVDGTQAEGKFLVSDANGVGTWKDTTGNTTIINSTTGAVVDLPSTGSMTYIGSSAVVPQDGYYIISPRLTTDKSPSGCGVFIAYNLFKSSTSVAASTGQAFESQDAHSTAGRLLNDYVYTSSVAYLTAGTYYMWARQSASCTTNRTRATSGDNSFTLTLLK
ncbi:hypothetical protein [Chryseobacterium sp.]|uniref:hypothetical protein n=1 Tax=Chryseobacterium sp. TaxID=1871047 RepID=UPI00289C6987|nr:hypothetical protein [Chryseobacterium sp.]